MGSIRFTKLLTASSLWREQVAIGPTVLVHKPQLRALSSRPISPLPAQPQARGRSASLGTLGNRRPSSVLSPHRVPIRRNVVAKDDPSSSRMGTLLDPSAWSQQSKHYSQSFSAFTFQYGRDALAALAPVPGTTLLDVACGPGTLALHAAKEVGLQVTACDFSPGMITQLQEQIGVANVQAHVMDGQHLEFANDTFDNAISSFGVVLFTDFVRGLTEMVRVVKPGAAMAVVTWAAPSPARLKPWLEYLEHAMPDILPIPLPPGVEAMNTAAGMVDAMQAAGIDGSLVTVHERTYPYEIADPSQFAEQTSSHPWMQDIKSRLTPEQFDQLAPGFVAFMERKRSESEAGIIQYKPTALIGIAHKPSE